jgi:hypothetical protein
MHFISLTDIGVAGDEEMWEYHNGISFGKLTAFEINSPF